MTFLKADGSTVVAGAHAAADVADDDSRRGHRRPRVERRCRRSSRRSTCCRSASSARCRGTRRRTAAAAEKAIGQTRPKWHVRGRRAGLLPHLPHGAEPERGGDDGDGHVPAGGGAVRSCATIPMAADVAARGRCRQRAGDRDPAPSASSSKPRSRSWPSARCISATCRRTSWPAVTSRRARRMRPTSWFFAEGATGAFFDTFLLIGNPGDDRRRT